MEADFLTHAKLVFVCAEVVPEASGRKGGGAHWADGGRTWFLRPDETGLLVYGSWFLNPCKPGFDVRRGGAGG
eukprot:5911176-Pleurochrysis_carterae.AAC.1